MSAEHRGSTPGRAMLAGVVATFVAVSVGYWMPAIGLLRLDLPILNGNLVVPASSASTSTWLIGTAQTLLIGGLLAVVYWRWIRSRLPGRGLARGTIWGALIGIVAGLTYFPLVYGAGAFGLGWEPQAPLALGLWFLTWGATLGLAEEILEL